jgi:hypothetical protein
VNKFGEGKMGNFRAAGVSDIDIAKLPETISDINDY